MPNRILRDGIIESERVNALSPQAELFYRRLMSKADDYGRFHGNLELIRAACYPLQLDRITAADVRVWLTECGSAPTDSCDRMPLVTEYEVDGRRYVQINDFNQRVRGDSKFPPPTAR